MKILVACEESQAVTIELRKLGHEAYSCDIEPCSGGHPEWHLQVDALELLKMKWDMIIAFPPCTYLSNAGACRLYPKKGQIDEERYQKGLQAKDFFLRFLNADCPRVAVENPVSSRIFEMPPHSQEIQPYEYGHPYTKKDTVVVARFAGITPNKYCRTYRPLCPGWNKQKRQKQVRFCKTGRGRKKPSKNISGNCKSYGIPMVWHLTRTPLYVIIV